MIKTFTIEIEESALSLSEYTPETFQERLESIKKEAENQAEKVRHEKMLKFISENESMPAVVTLNEAFEQSLVVVEEEIEDGEVTPE
jgi:hypothetical protein